ncbi:DUF805 domain-containing protein [Labrenzia sp. VG12]|uniref:DUF805 domain-containing protein n=1 Tax=Labrenzia sp. VG12 TaxID=2021862 RepID=UPI0012FDB65C|nr:DUF805 domain-containing protein [Labrenzia sp. VG12]
MTPSWSRQQTSVNSGPVAQAYASPGYGALPEDEDSFSIFKVFGFTLGMLFSFQGRIGRAEYWTIGLIRFVIFIGAAIAYGSTLQPVNGELDSLVFMRGFVETTSGVMFLLLFLALTVCLYSLEVRRLHDRDASGFWLLIMFIPIVGGFYALWLFIANGFFAGTPGHNRFDTGHSQAAVFD